MILTPPNRIVIDFLEGITNRADAIAYARGFITSHFDVPEISGYYVQPYKGGFAYEVHEGGSRKAFLPGILRTLEDNPGTTVSIRSGSRVLQVSKGQRDSFNSILLPEELSSYLENVVEPDEKAPSLIPYQMDNVLWLFSGGAIGFIGGLIFIICMAFYAFDPSQNKIPDLNVTPANQLPMAQWQNMMGQLTGHDYISAMRYQNGQWRFETKSTDSNADNDKLSDIDTNAGPVIMSPDQTKTPAMAPVPPPSPTGIPVAPK
jgi:hypothetical protein